MTKRTTKAADYRPVRETEIEEFTRFVAEAFVRPLPVIATWLDKPVTANGRVLLENGRMVAGALLHPMGQYFGGRAVPMLGPGGVFVVSEARGRGVATKLLEHIGNEARERGFAISTLYPASRQLYGKAGFAPGGVRVQRLVEHDRVGLRGGPLEVRRGSEADADALRKVHADAARRTNGWLDRTQYKWNALFRSGDEVRTVFVAEGRGGPQGYIIVSNLMRNDQKLLHVEDAAFLSREAATSLLVFAARHGFQSQGIVWFGGWNDPFDSLLLESRAKIEGAMEWYVRIEDIERALTARGYPENLRAELHLHVRDEQVVSNTGRYILTLKGGRGRVERGGDGRIWMDVRTLATLFAGFRTPAELPIDGPAQDLETLQFAFSGPAPHMCDMF